MDNDRYFEITGITPDIVDTPIRDINLCVFMDYQGACDESKTLTVPRPYRSRYIIEPPPANHWALWFGLGELFNIAIDVVQENHTKNPFINDPLEVGAMAVVRVAYKKIPSRDNMGCVLRDFNIRPGVTVAMVIRMIVRKELHMYRFTPLYKQHAGCRHWIVRFARELEAEEFVGRGFAADVERFVKIFYGRSIEKKNGRWVSGAVWGPRPEVIVADIVPGVFITAVKEEPVD